MGTRNDTFRRNRHRVDNDLNWRIDLTWRWIYQDGMALMSMYIDCILTPLSLTPTWVRPPARPALALTD